MLQKDGFALPQHLAAGVPNKWPIFIINSCSKKRRRSQKGLETQGASNETPIPFARSFMDCMMSGTYARILHVCFFAAEGIEGGL